MANDGSRDDGPRFSVIVPAYNAESTLAETLQHVRYQEFTDWECIVVDDGSTDDTAAVAFSFAEADQRFVVVRQENAGTAGAYNSGVRTARADLLTICSSDDLLLPLHLQVMDRLAVENPEFEIYSSNGEYLWDESGARRHVYVTEERPKPRSLSFEDVVDACFYGVGAVFRREAYDLAGGYRPTAHTEDYDFWLRAMARGARHLYTPEVLSVHRVSACQKSADVARLFESNLEVLSNLLATESLSRPQERAVQRAIAITRRQLDSSEKAVAADFEDQARKLRGIVEKVVGPDRADGAMRFIRSFSWIVRPLRRWMAASRHRGS